MGGSSSKRRHRICNMAFTIGSFMYGRTPSSAQVRSSTHEFGGNASRRDVIAQNEPRFRRLRFSRALKNPLAEASGLEFATRNRLREQHARNEVLAGAGGGVHVRLIQGLGAVPGIARIVAHEDAAKTVVIGIRQGLGER